MLEKEVSLNHPVVNSKFGGNKKAKDRLLINLKQASEPFLRYVHGVGLVSFDDEVKVFVYDERFKRRG